jgi:hypothetical protein
VGYRETVSAAWGSGNGPNWMPREVIAPSSEMTVLVDNASPNESIWVKTEHYKVF